MKCPYCGAPLDLDDNFCSHCGKLNEQVKQHVDDMNRFKTEFSETKEEVYKTTKRYTAVTVRVVMIALLVILNVAIAVVGSRYYSFERMLGEADSEQRASLCKYTADSLEYFYENLDMERYSYYENYDREENLKAIAGLKEKVEMLLVTYGGVSSEDAALFETNTSAKRAMILEEGMLR